MDRPYVQLLIEPLHLGAASNVNVGKAHTLLCLVASHLLVRGLANQHGGDPSKDNATKLTSCGVGGNDDRELKGWREIRAAVFVFLHMQLDPGIRLLAW